MTDKVIQPTEIAPGVLCLASAHKATYSRAVDADWRGDTAEAKRLFGEASRMDERIKAGELYEPQF